MIPWIQTGGRLLRSLLEVMNKFHVSTVPCNTWSMSRAICHDPSSTSAAFCEEKQCQPWHSTPRTTTQDKFPMVLQHWGNSQLALISISTSTQNSAISQDAGFRSWGSSGPSVSFFLMDGGALSGETEHPRTFSAVFHWHQNLGRSSTHSGISGCCSWWLSLSRVRLLTSKRMYYFHSSLCVLSELSSKIKVKWT